MDRRDYAAAVDFLRDALARQPSDLEAHYRLGVSTSHLDKVDDAAREFEWVVTNGAQGRPEVQLARDWLASRTPANVSGPRVIAVPSSDEQGRKPEDGQRPDLANLSGKAMGPDKPMTRLQLFLKGTPGSSVKDEYHVLRTDQQGNFTFLNVVPGEYVLTNAIAGLPKWQLRVALARGERRRLDLTPDNDTTVRNDVPESPR